LDAGNRRRPGLVIPAMKELWDVHADAPETRPAELRPASLLRRMGVVAVALALGAAGFGVAFVALRDPPSPLGASGAAESPTEGAQSPTPSPTYLTVGERWAPPTYPEGDLLVMPVTFPDGTSAELVYPPELALEELSVYPDTFADGGPRQCGWSVHATRYDAHAGWITGEEPLAEHVRAGGATVGLWEGTPDNEPYDYLVYRFGSWSVLVPCLGGGAIDQEALAVWAENLHGQETPDGLLALEGTPPLVLHPWRDQNGPTLRLSGNDVVIDIRPRSEQCDPASGWGGDTDAADGVVQWCVEPEGGIYVYANAFAPGGKDLLQALVDDLEVRGVPPPPGIADS
jgi:hypothetical protein